MSVGKLISGTSTVDNGDLPFQYVSAIGSVPKTAGTFFQAVVAAGSSISRGNINLLRLTRKSGSLPLQDTNQGASLVISITLIAA